MMIWVNFLDIFFFVVSEIFDVLVFLRITCVIVTDVGKPHPVGMSPLH